MRTGTITSSGFKPLHAKQSLRNPRTHRCLPSRGSLRQRCHQDSCSGCPQKDDSNEKAAHPLNQQAFIAASIFISEACCRGALANEAVPKFGPVQVGPQIWFGAIVATIPFVIGSWEFAQRILIQRRCQECEGSGLVMRGRFARKCPECGGFFPWQGWKRFFTSTALPGNGGPLRQPRGQTSIFYKVPEDPRKASGSQEALVSKEAQQQTAQKEKTDNES